MIASVRPVLLEFVFDPIDLRTKRQAALANAMNTPLFKEHQEVKEFVFDSLFDLRMIGALDWKQGKEAHEIHFIGVYAHQNSGK